jgi:hypothetical protein
VVVSEGKIGVLLKLGLGISRSQNVGSWLCQDHPADQMINLSLNRQLEDSSSYESTDFLKGFMVASWDTNWTQDAVNFNEREGGLDEPGA